MTLACEGENGCMKLSVIMPVYNTQEYLKDAIESVLNSKKLDFELLIIDDGSTDESGKICDQYTLADQRIKVFHKKNGGLSSARNRGLEIATGEYIGFVDSDDMVSPDMFHDMIKCAEERGADIVCCGIDYLGTVHHCTVTPANVEEYSNGACQQLLLRKDGVGDYYPNKIYKREILLNTNWGGFPEGKLFEDIYTQFKVFHYANKVVSMNKYYYLYRMNAQSISHKKKFNPQKMDFVYSCYEQYNYIKYHNPEYIDLASAKYISSVIIMAKGYTKNYIYAPENRMLKELRYLAIEWRKQNNYTKYISDELKSEIESLLKGLIHWRIFLHYKKIYKGFHCRPRVQRLLKQVWGDGIIELEKEKWQF